MRGEAPGISPEEALKYVSEKSSELNMVFQFEHMDLDVGPGGEWKEVKDIDLVEFKEIMSKWQYKMDDG